MLFSGIEIPINRCFEKSYIGRLWRLPARGENNDGPEGYEVLYVFFHEKSCLMGCPSRTRLIGLPTLVWNSF